MRDRYSTEDFSSKNVNEGARVKRLILWFWLGTMAWAAAEAQKPSLPRATPAGGTISALLISDIHFDPFHDPAKAPRLERAPVSEWPSILAEKDSPGQAEGFTGLQKKCDSKGVDTPYSLLASSLAAMHEREPKPAFLTLTGDLVVHDFPCRFDLLARSASPAAYADFVTRTMQFVVNQLRARFPGVPILISLGNNDTPCGDYQMDPGSSFLRRASGIVADAQPGPMRSQVLQEFPAGGYYSVPMSAPMRKTRMIVLNDLFLSPRYRTCAGRIDEAAGAAEMDWLRQQLAEARQSGQRVWVMGHIPPGVNVYATVRKLRNVCAGEEPEFFLDAEKLDDLLTQYADVVRLALFAHTHMDEIRLIEPETSGGDALERGVAAKLVPSISPVDGNNPSFTIARVDPATAVLKDYEVIVASNQTGIGTQWREEYDYARSYHEPDFSPRSLSGLIGEFREDPHARTQASQQYIDSWFKGGIPGRALIPFWPQYTCALANTTAKSYASCVCR